MHERLATILGPSPSWPRALDAALGVCMAARVPMMVWWRATGAVFYNEATIAFLGVQRPFGEPLDRFGDDAFAALVKDLTKRVVDGDRSVAIDEFASTADPHAPTEAVFDVTASPVHDAGVVAAVLVTLVDITVRVVTARRTKLLRALAQRASTSTPPIAPSSAVAHARAVAAALEVLRADGSDFAASAIYLVDERGDAILTGAFGLGNHPALTPTTIALSSSTPWPLASSASTRGGVRVASAAGPAVVLPIPRADGEMPLGFFIAVLQERVLYDDRCALVLRMIALELASAASSGRVQDDRDRLQEFLAMLAHELRNPLAPIRTALTLLDARIGSDERARHYLNTVERQSGNLARLVDDLLDVSRITRGLIALQTESVDLGGVVDRALETLRPTLEAKSIDVAVTKPMRPVRMIGDPLRLEQIVLNLIGNAAKYTNRGGHVRIALEQSGTLAELHVKDDGVGISPDMLPRVFDLFQQAQRSLDRSQGGLGIGLTIVKSLVALHNGSVEAKSDGTGLGSEFIVRLPAVDLERTTTPPSPIAAPEKAAPGARRILVVDDNIDAADTLADLAAEWGHTVKSAHTGPEALAAAFEMIPDIVLLDIGLPEMDGYEVARRMRANPALDDAFLIALTGYGQQRDRERAAEAGFDHHLVKPVNIDRLEELLRSARRRPERPMGEQVH